ncbi:MAG: hypothetical protein IKM97_01805 [Clostridia bacterium]|nr:hypothetical protein [Clostridia bacterium]
MNDSAIESFLNSYAKGNVTPQKLEYLKRVATENPNILNKMSYAILTDEIFEMGEEFVTRIARYPNISSKLVQLLEISFEVFQTIKAGFIELEKTARRPETLEIEQKVLSYVINNYKDLQGLSFEQIANMAIQEIEEITIYTEKGFEVVNFGEANSSPLDELHHKYDIIQRYAQSFVYALHETAEVARSIEEVVYFDVNGKRVKQINFHGNFNFLVHSTDSGFKEEKKILDGNFKKTWSQNPDIEAHLTACCFINQDFLGYVPARENGVLMIFSDLQPDDISLMGPVDINSHITEYDCKAGRPVYICAKEMPYHSRRVYSEIPIENREPDFILVFDDMPDSVLQNSYKAAADFDIPVLFMSKSELEQNQIDTLYDMIQDYYSKSDLSILSSLVSIYETNVAGWLLNRDNSITDNSFTKGINNERFREDFEFLGTIIFKLLDEYISKLAEKQNNSTDISIIGRIISSELEKYRLANKDKISISVTKPSIDYKYLLERCFLIRMSENSKLSRGKGIEPSIAEIAETAVNKGGLGLTEINSLIRFFK